MLSSSDRPDRPTFPLHSSSSSSINSNRPYANSSPTYNPRRSSLSAQPPVQTQSSPYPSVRLSSNDQSFPSPQTSNPPNSEAHYPQQIVTLSSPPTPSSTVANADQDSWNGPQRGCPSPSLASGSIATNGGPFPGPSNQQEDTIELLRTASGGNSPVPPAHAEEDAPLPPLPLPSPPALGEPNTLFTGTTTYQNSSTGTSPNLDRSNSNSPNLGTVEEADEARQGLGFGSILETRPTEGFQRLGPLGGTPEHRPAQPPPVLRDEEPHEDLIEVGFDEGVLKGLYDLDCGMPLLLERTKQGMASAREASTFFKKRAVIEDEYARSLIKLSRSSSDSYSLSEGKAGTYVSTWHSFLRTHELLADNRLKLAAQLSEMSDELNTLAKEADRNRKASKELGARLERGLAEQDALVDKARARFDAAAEELEKVLLQKQGESIKDPSNFAHAFPATSPGTGSGATSITGTNKRTFGKAMSKLKGPKSMAQAAKQEDEVRSKMGQSSDSYRGQVLGAQAIRNEYFNLQLPRILRSLKDSIDEVDLGTQYHLARYCYLHESTVVNDGLTISPVNPEDGLGLKAVIDGLDIREDFKTFMQQFALSWQMSGQRGPRREAPPEDGFLTTPSKPTVSPRHSVANMHQAFVAPPIRPTFGVDLGEQMLRDNVEVPRVLEKCCEAIELHGLESMGIYRLSGTTSRVQRLKGKLDRDIEGTDLLSEENLTDINDIAAVMKLWFREMPEPLLTWELYHGFIEAAKIENDRLRHIRLHERVNDLPDPNYATLKYLMGHLDKVKAREHINQMSGSNLAIVFGPNLLGAPPTVAGAQGTALADMSWQCKCIETILQHYVEIFVDTDS